MDLSKITDKAKELIRGRGGAEALEEDATELKDIATKDESMMDKAKDAVEALKDPGASGEEPAAPAS